jgi:DNA-binding response OmpR family regulator
VLIVDDDQAVTKVLAQFFRAQGFAVATAYSGEEGLTRLEGGPVDLVLIDLLLPGISGFQVLRRAKQLHPKARVVMITGLEEEDLRAKAKAYGADAYVAKPFTFSDPIWASLMAPAQGETPTSL